VGDCISFRVKNNVSLSIARNRPNHYQHKKLNNETVVQFFCRQQEQSNLIKKDKIW